MKGTKLYIVSGSEDGTIGVFTSTKKAVEAAIDYVVGNSPDQKPFIPAKGNVDHAPSHYDRELRQYGFTRVESRMPERDCTSHIEMTFANSANGFRY